MGVRGYLWMLQKKIPTCILEHSIGHFDVVYIDGNCVVHDQIDRLAEHTAEAAAAAVGERLRDISDKFPESRVAIVFDGVPPRPKQYCQRLRRRTPSNPVSPMVLPTTHVMATIEAAAAALVATQPNRITLDGSDRPGEGEHKIMAAVKAGAGSALILTADSDLVILSQVYLYDLVDEPRICVKTQSLTIDVNEVHRRMRERFSVTDLLAFCRACGNDYFPKLTELRDVTCADIYRSGRFRPSDLSIGECACALEETVRAEAISCYANLSLWYVRYFTTNECISCAHYGLESAPCCHCLLSHVDEPLRTQSIDPGEHLAFVFERDDNLH